MRAFRHQPQLTQQLPPFVSTEQRQSAGYQAEDNEVPCTKVLSQEIQIFQEMHFCVLQVSLRNFTNTLWQLYIDFYTIRMALESSFRLCTFKVANLKKLWQFWQKRVDRTFVHGTLDNESLTEDAIR